MKSGRVSRTVRQWANFSFLLLLLAFVGWFSWKTCLQKVMEIPAGHVQLITKKSGFLFFRTTEEIIRGPGKYAISAAEVEQIQEGKLTCFPLSTMSYEVQGVVETSGTLQGLKAKVGWGNKSFVAYSGVVSIDVEEQNVMRIASEDFRVKIKESFEDATIKFSSLLREENVEKFKEEVGRTMQETLELSHIAFTIDHLETKAEGPSVATLTARKGQVITPVILEELPAGGYASIAVALFVTTFVYALVRSAFAELLGVLFVIFIGIPLSAFGFGNFQLHEPGYYQNQRRRGPRSGSRQESEAGYGVGEALLDIGSAAVDLIPSHNGPDISDAVGTLGDAAGTIGDAADAIGGIGEAAGSIFDGLGFIGDLF